MKKVLLLFMFFIMMTSSAYATNYIQTINVTVGKDTATYLEVTCSEPIEYSVGKLVDSKKIYFDLKNTILRERKTFTANSNNVTTVRVAQNAVKPTCVSRIVFDMDKITDYTEKLSEDKKTLTVIFGEPAVAAMSTAAEVIEKKVVVIDAGHGGNDPGAVISDLSEKNLNLNIALKVQKLLADNPYIDVYMTRTDDTYIALLDRAKFANDKKADLFVSIHNNSMPKSFKGTMLLYNSSKIVSNKTLAESFQKTISTALGMGSIGARSREDLVVLKNIEVPGVLVEVACMSNIKERRVLRTESFKQKAAEAIYNSIIEAVLE